MAEKILPNINWYEDKNALENNEPGLYHSFISSLASSVNYIEGEVDPVRLMGTSAFAFRIFVNEIFCPSAMSVFNWKKILPESIRQYNYDCKYFSRMWEEGHLEKDKREEAQAAIIKAVDNGTPAVVWDVADAEWGLIIGYDLKKSKYITMTHGGERSTLPFDKLGKNGIDVLSVTIPTGRNNRDREEVLRNSLKVAVAHAEQKEWMDRPEYQDGLPAFDLWASLFEKWALLIEYGKAKNIGTDIFSFSKYYAGTHFSARCYARDYLRMISNGNENLQKAAHCYQRVAGQLKPVWDYFSKNEKSDRKLFLSFAENIREAKKDEEEGISYIKKYLNEN
ncbi:hypothetical protein ACFL4T_06030 [candidate division KSB1 bacterium]